MVRTIRPVRPAATAEPPKPQIPLTPAQKRKNLSVFLIMLALPLVAVTSTVLYRRVFQGQEKRVQQGEYTSDGGLRLFDKEERQERDKESILTRIFGQEK